MLKFLMASMCCVGVSGFAVAEPLSFVQATTLSFSDTRISVGEDADSGWYITPQFGITSIGNHNDSGLRITFDRGQSLGVGIGKELHPGFRLQFDVAYIKNDLDEFIFPALGIVQTVPGSTITQIPLTLSAVWEPSNHNRFLPYFGLGVGAIHGEYDIPLPGINTERFSLDWAIALQVKAGLKFALSHSSDITVGYQYMHAHYHRDLDLNSHTFSLGLVFKF